MDFYGLQDSLKQNNSIGSSQPVTIEDRYELLEQLGKGAYGVVWMGKKRVGNCDTPYAIKQINVKHAGEKGLQDVIGEVETMSLLNHPNIVRLEETFRDETSLWIVMEYLPGGELQQALKAKCMDQETTRVIVTQLLDALEYIHDRGIVHRDLKPANCLLSERDSVVKISDFGFAVLAGSDQCLTTYCGTVAFMAPEILRDKNYGKPVDMWALGVMTFMMIFGRFPFSGETVHDLTRCILKNAALNDEPGLSREPVFRDFLGSLLNTDPNKRATAKEALKHPWIRASLGTRATASSPKSKGSQSKRKSHLFRSAALAVMAMHRFIYWSKYRRLVKIESEQIRILRNLHFMVSGEYSPPNASIDCSEVFAGKPEALELLFTMLESSRTVERVDLSKNNIDSLSVIQNLLKVLTRHCSISGVNLAYNPIPALAGRGILRLARNPSCRLRYVNLEHTNMPNDIVGQIASALRDKKVIPVESAPVVCKSPIESTPILPLESLPSSQTRSQHQSPHPTPHSSISLPSAKKSRKRSTRLPPLPQAALSKRHDRMPSKFDGSDKL